ncbi:helix-turn-helix transcriptional regulator [Amycolatopsis minnesotensis]|uniref:LuxR family transcriptional regulator n=1 Tax=Amycolatopsis minnesotensis TaxID=337894 RepID=A0ABP5BH38_9PSEU
MSAQGASPVLVGRERETARLADALARCARGEYATVLVGGEAGIGKSRLVAEFTGAADARVLLGGCVDLGGADLPFVPFVAALRGLIADPDFGEAVPAKVRADLGPLLPAETAGEPRGTGDDARARLFEGTLTVLARLAAGRPLVLVVEDAHWADRSSRDLLQFLVRNQRAIPGSLLVVTHRSDELGRAHPLRSLLAELGRVPWVERIDLARLSRREVVHQVRAILDAEPAPELVGAVHERSEGNPLFVEAVLEAGDGPLPPSLDDLLLARVDRLTAHTPGAAPIVRAASAAVGRVDHELLVTVAGSAPGEAVSAAVDAGVLVVDGDGYAFRHALIRDAVYRTLLPGERIALHARYADAIRAGASGGHWTEELAHHLYAARKPGEALHAAWEAANVARRSLAYAEQLRLLSRVLELWDRVPDAADRVGAGRFTVLERATEAANRAGDPEEGDLLATAALAELDPGTDRVRTALLLELRGRMRGQLGRPDALGDRRRAVEIVPDGHPARGFLLNALAAALMEVPLEDEARQYAQRGLAAAHEAGDDPSEASALVTLAVLDARDGDLDAQLPRLARARAIAENVDAPRERLRALHSESTLLHAYGRLGEAVSVARSGLVIARDAGLARSYGAAHAVDLITALISAGRWDEALESGDHALELAPPAGFSAQVLCLKGFVALRRGDRRLPDGVLARVHALPGTEIRFPPDPLLVPRLEIELRLAQDRADAAAAVLDRALTGFGAAASRFAWPLLVAGSRVAHALGADDLRSRLRAQAETLRAAGPVQEAHARSFAAEITREDVTAWESATEAWRELGQPWERAETAMGAAEAAIAAGERTRAAAHLGQVAALTAALGATPLRERATDLARRARITPGERAPRTGSHGLTPRELEILHLVADGLGNADIGERLFISAKTASVHVSNILGKLAVANRVEAAAQARRLGLLT